MYSIASWSPSQSDPLIVSYMCHSQLSSDMLPSAAPMPPCAATVCERVGKTLDRTATDKPASANCSDARMPAPPAPTMSASNLRTGRTLTPSPPRRCLWVGLRPDHRRASLSPCPQGCRRSRLGLLVPPPQERKRGVSASKGDSRLLAPFGLLVPTAQERNRGASAFEGNS